MEESKGVREIPAGEKRKKKAQKIFRIGARGPGMKAVLACYLRDAAKARKEDQENMAQKSGAA